MTEISEEILNKVTELRHKLHQYPELSNEESQTAKTISGFLTEEHPPSKLIENIGGNGLLAIYKSKNSGPLTLFRAELDALPIQEENDNLEYASHYAGCSHKCGHDGHMAMLCGLALYLKDNPLKSGSIGLLFQPAEETGEGANQVLKDRKFSKFNPDAIYALHNLPGYPEGSIIIPEEVFASASTGLIAKLSGHTSHAGHPENACSPTAALGQLLSDLPSLPHRILPFDRSALITIIQASLGEVAFGTTPGYAEIRATLRTHFDNDMDKLCRNTQNYIKKIGKAHDLSVETSLTEDFPATHNHKRNTEILLQSFKQAGLKIVKRAHPMSWSEDFGNFLQTIPGAIFGLGSGKKMPQLHNPDYDFPDTLLPYGIKAFASVLEETHQNL